MTCPICWEKADTSFETGHITAPELSTFESKTMFMHLVQYHRDLIDFPFCNLCGVEMHAPGAYHDTTELARHWVHDWDEAHEKAAELSRLVNL